MFLIVALSSYFFSALTVIFDKFLLGSKRIPSAPVYSFYIGLFGLFTLGFIPFFDFSIPSFFQIMISFLSGALFSVGILFLYFAIQKAEASRVSPIVGAAIPVMTYLLSFLTSSETFVISQVAGIGLLIIGGLLISFDLPLALNKKKFFSGFGFSLWAGIFLALSYFLLKIVYGEQAFMNGFVWTRLGSFVGVLAYFFVPGWRKEICASFHGFKKPKKRSLQTGFLFVGNKIIGGLSSILFNYAIAIGSVTIANSLVSSQYVFVLGLAFLAHKKFPKIYGEKLYFWDWMQKIGAIVLIGTGIVLLYAI